MVTMSLAQDLKADGVTVIALHPGWVKTRMGGPSAPVAPADSVTGQQALFERVTIKDTGSFFDFTGATLPW
jgi:NAD(P)-dependent dehydrogenase (short-subunit alcohol dehydrogenase family)